MKKIKIETQNIGESFKVSDEALDEILELARSKRVKKVGRWVPKYRERYWYIASFGEVTEDKHDGQPADAGRISIGNCFRTSAEAKRALVKLRKIKLNKIGGEKRIAS